MFGCEDFLALTYSIAKIPRALDRICCRISSSCWSDGLAPSLSHVTVQFSLFPNTSSKGLAVCQHVVDSSSSDSSTICLHPYMSAIALNPQAIPSEDPAMRTIVSQVVLSRMTSPAQPTGYNGRFQKDTTCPDIVHTVYSSAQ